jgi:hypothetical protein
MTALSMEDIDVDENTATIAYTLLVAMSATLDVSYVVGEGFTESHIAVADSQTGEEHFRLYVSPVMADLLVAVLQQVGESIQDSFGKPTWRSMT